MRKPGPPEKRPPGERFRNAIIGLSAIAVVIVIVSVYFSGILAPQNSLTSVNQTMAITVHEASGYHWKDVKIDMPDLVGHYSRGGMKLEVEYTASNGTMVVRRFQCNTPELVIDEDHTSAMVTIENGTSKTLILMFMETHYVYTGPLSFTAFMDKYRI